MAGDSGAALSALALLALAWALFRYVHLRKPARWLTAILVAQLATGLSNVVLGWPLVAAVLHTGGAGAMLAVLVWMLATTKTTTVAAFAPDYSRRSTP